MTLAIIDADILIYEAAATCETTTAWPFGENSDDGCPLDYLYTRTANGAEAWARLHDSFAALVEAVGGVASTLCITGPGKNWRNDVYGDYKSNRKSAIKPLLVPLLRQQLTESGEAWSVPGLEGDDLMGLLQRNNGKTICVTIDKDLKTIPGRHYNFRKQEFFEVTEAEANRWHLIQTLTGDQTDGYPGCKGIGIKKAENLIPDPVPTERIPEVWRDVVLPAFHKAGFNEGFALSQARVARILRHGEYDAVERKVILWNP